MGRGEASSRGLVRVMAYSGRRILQLRFVLGYLAPVAVVLVALAGCATPSPTASPLRLPTRSPPTPTPTPIGVQVYYETGLARRAVGDVVGALAAFSQTLAADPAFAPAYVQRGTIRMVQGDPQAALADAQAALAADSECAAAYVLLGEVLRLDFEAPAQALTAYEQAVRLDPSLAEPTFPARWRAATAAGRAQRMIALANEHEDAHPDDPLAAYYRGRALTALGASHTAIRVLVETLGEEGGPAAVWFVLGEAYAADGAWAHALTCFEHVRALTEAGDNSLALVSDTPVADLFGALGAAYVYTDRCADAQTMLNHALAVGPDRPEYHTLIGQAMICQTPTPTPTPYPWLAP